MNIDIFKTAGVNLQYEASWNNLKATAGVGYVGRYNMLLELDKTLPQFMWSPELVSNISYAWQKPALTFNLHYKYTGRLPFYQRQLINGTEQIRLAEISAFHWMDGTVQKQFWKNKFTVQGGVRNIFNLTNIANTGVAQGAHGTAGPQAIGYGRSFFLNTSFQF